MGATLLSGETPELPALLGGGWAGGPQPASAHAHFCVGCLPGGRVGEEDMVVCDLFPAAGRRQGWASPVLSPQCSGLRLCAQATSSAPLLLVCLFLGPEAKLVLCSHVTVVRRGPLAASPSFHQNHGFGRCLGHSKTRAPSPFTGAPGGTEAAEGTWGGECSNSCFWSFLKR